MLPIFVLSSVVPVWGSRKIMTIHDVKKREQSQNEQLSKELNKYLNKVEQSIKETNDILDRFVGKGYFDEKKRREEEVEQEVRRRIDEDKIIQPAKKLRKKAIKQIQGNLLNHDFTSPILKKARDDIEMTEEVIAAKKKKIREKVEEEIPEVPKKGLLGREDKSKKKWAEISEEAIKFEIELSEELSQRRAENENFALKAAGIACSTFGLITVLFSFVSARPKPN